MSNLFDDYTILNNEAFGNSVPVAEINDDPLLLSKNLQKLMLKLKGENFIDEKTIDYNNLIKSDFFKNDYLKLAEQLKQIDLNKLIQFENDSNILAFFINIYNALTIHAIAYLHYNDYSLSSNNDASMLSQADGKFWSKMAYKIGHQVFSLDDIEHGILRANRPHPSRKEPLFGPNDERCQFSIKKFDPRIHFALNCGAKGCPPISFYTADNLDRGLESAAVNFINSETTVDVPSKTVELSRLFLWYKLDFIEESVNHSNEDELLLNFINHYLCSPIKEDLSKLLENSSKEIKIIYSSYNWLINSKK